MALSLSSNLAHAPPINGLYSFIINPFFYAILGSSSQLIVGPEAAGSLLVGTVVKATVESGHSSEMDDAAHAQVVGIVTGLAGAFIFIAGLTRLGFLDNVLSRPFLRGFITAIGVVIFVDQLIPEMGLYDRAEAVNHASTVEKFVFILENGEYAHKLTTVVAFSSFAIIMAFRLVILSFRNTNMLINGVEPLKKRLSLVSPRLSISQTAY
jgi:MFS superfamily sulfate permease-like transporter